MAKINILPAKVYNRIAAGEVVDRPYSVVKELLENAIDAGATEIEIYIEKGGKELIRVVDNGCGIAREDLHSAFLPHATSKIESGGVYRVCFKNDDHVAGGRRKMLSTFVKRRRDWSNHGNGGRKRHGRQSGNAVFQCTRAFEIFKIG